MKKIFSYIVLTLICSLSALDSCYHNNEEIKEFIFNLKEQYPQFVKIDSIGVTLNENRTIWAVKLSDNPEIDEDEPAVMFAGMCHAEEVLGTEVTLHMMEDILIHRNLPPYQYWLSELEIWFVPTYNPEGLAVVHSGLDDSFRKNKRDNNNNGIFDFINQPGNDIDGVDLNRNYGFNWIHGDTLYCEDGEERYDYYRGHAPFSEGGTKAIRNLAAKQHFIYSINWHSSRTGNFSEQLFYSFEHAVYKKSADFELIREVGEKVASLIETEDGTGCYKAYPSIGRKGSAHDWFYQKHGTIQFLIECGTSNLQPDSLIMKDTCIRNAQGAYYLLNRAMCYTEEDYHPQLSGHITDAQTNEPLDAEIIVEEHHAPYFAKRKADSLYGRYFRPLKPGSYNLTVKKEGYATKRVENVVVNSSCETIKNISLNPLNSVTFNGQIKLNGNLSKATIYVQGDYPQEIEIENGFFSLETYEGDLEFYISAPDASPCFYKTTMSAEIESRTINLNPEVLIFAEDFSEGLENWSVNGDWEITNFGDEAYLEDSPSGFYKDGQSYFVSTNNQLQLGSDKTIIELNHEYYTEHGIDKCQIQVSPDNENWSVLNKYSGISEGFVTDFITLDDFQNKNIYLRMLIKSDATLNDSGWKINSIKVFNSQSVGISEEFINIPPNCELYANYPNPFNPFTNISFNLDSPAEAKLTIYNSLGQIVWSSKPKNYTKGKHSLIFNGKGLNSGLYFYTLAVNGFKTETKKMMLCK